MLRNPVLYDLFRITRQQGIIYVWNSTALNVGLVESRTLSILIQDNLTGENDTDTVHVKIVKSVADAPYDKNICGECDIYFQKIFDHYLKDID